MLVIVPSRGRPDNVTALIDAWDRTRAYAQLLIVVDDDDELLDRYEMVMETAPAWVSLEVTPRKRLGPTLNEYAVKNAPLYDIVGFMGDDHRPRTPHWDRRFAMAIAQMGGVGITYGNDLIQGPNLPTAVWMSSCIVETLGYMVPPGIVHLFADNFWKAVGEGIGRLNYLSDVVIEHVHPVAQKAEWDDTYKECNAGEIWESDEKTFQAYMTHAYVGDMDKIRERCINR
jgi:hypothetical protein